MHNTKQKRLGYQKWKGKIGVLVLGYRLNEGKIVLLTCTNQQKNPEILKT